MYPDIDAEGRCVECGRERHIGDWPACPHPASHTSAHGDDIPGGMVLENYGPTPITVYSHTERLKIMKERGLELKERFCPKPGTDRDPAGVMNPAGYVDPQTLLNAATLILRAQGQPVEEEFDPDTVIRDRESRPLSLEEFREIRRLVGEE